MRISLSIPIHERPGDHWGARMQDKVQLVQSMHGVGYEMLQQNRLEDKFAGCMLLQVPLLDTVLVLKFEDL